MITFVDESVSINYCTTLVSCTEMYSLVKRYIYVFGKHDIHNLHRFVARISQQVSQKSQRGSQFLNTILDVRHN